MYGMPSKRFDPDIYKDRKDLRNRDFIAGFVSSGLLCFLLFRPVWFLAPLIIFCFSMIGIKYKFRRRYAIYGALSLIFFPFLLWALLMVGYAGKDELK